MILNVVITKTREMLNTHSSKGSLLVLEVYWKSQICGFHILFH